MKLPTDITQTESIQESWNKVEPSVSRMGFDYGVYCYINADRSAIGGIVTKNAIGWGKHHTFNGYGKYDPIGRLVHKKEKFTWNFKNEENKISKKLLSERKEYGMKCGITVPIINKYGTLISWISLAVNSSDRHFNGLIYTPDFSENVYNIHIKTSAYTLSRVTGIEFNICYAMVLSQYTTRIQSISEKTGFLVCDLQRLFSRLYLSYNKYDLSYLDAQQAAGLNVKGLHDCLKADDVLKYKFSKRQRECIELLKKGLTAKQAARILGISPRTYEWYISDLKQRLNCSNQRELIFNLSQVIID